MDLLQKLSDPQEWAAYFSYKAENRHLTRSEEQELKVYIEEKRYLTALQHILECDSFGVPEKKLIRKTDSDKKRTVYVFPQDENLLLKLFTYLLIREYDGIFSDNLFSFRVDFGVKRAMAKILSTPGLNRKYTYKVDISNYFNSIDTARILEELKTLPGMEGQLFHMFELLLSDRRCIDNGTVIEEDKGVMAGTPTAVFLANLYLRELDAAFEKTPVLYARYSDDIMIFADTEEEREAGAQKILRILKARGLSVNEKKEIRTSPGEQWTFLGIGYQDGVIDVSPVSKDKLKAKIRRKARAIKRWQVRKKASDEQAVKAFLRAMNKKFFDADSSHELTWTRWYFPLITTDQSLKEIDHYVQYWARYLKTGRHNEGMYRFRYEEMKELGYISLVHEWYEHRSEGAAPKNAEADAY